MGRDSFEECEDLKVAVRHDGDGARADTGFGVIRDVVSVEFIPLFGAALWTRVFADFVGTTVAMFPYEPACRAFVFVHHGTSEGSVRIQ